MTNLFFIKIIKNNFKLYVFMLVSLSLSFYICKLNLTELIRQNNILQKFESFNGDLITPKGSTLKFILEAIQVSPLSNDVIPRSLITTLEQNTPLKFELIQTPVEVIDPIWKNAVIHFAIVKTFGTQKEKLKELINKKTVAQYIDFEIEKNLLISEFSQTKNKIIQIFLSLFILMAIILYLILCLQLQIYNEYKNIFYHFGYTNEKLFLQFIYSYFIILTIASMILFI